MGATVWELVEGNPPTEGITDEGPLPSRWAPLTRPEVYTRSLHEFLRLCSEPSDSRPTARDLLSVSFCSMVDRIKWDERVEKWLDIFI